METLMQELQKLSSAEEFFAYFGIDYEPRVVHVSRLHILKRFNQYLAREKAAGLAAAAELEAYARCRELLERAYQDFVGSSGIEQKVFKVFQQGVQHVSVEGLRRSIGELRHA